jgi:hypothetical protein
MNFELEEVKSYPIGLFSKAKMYGSKMDIEIDPFGLAAATDNLYRFVMEKEEQVLMEQLSKYGYSVPGYTDLGLKALKRLQKVIGEIIEQREAENAQRSNG